MFCLKPVGIRNRNAGSIPLNAMAKIAFLIQIIKLFRVLDLPNIPYLYFLQI